MTRAHTTQKRLAVWLIAATATVAAHVGMAAVRVLAPSEHAVLQKPLIKVALRPIPPRLEPKTPEIPPIPPELPPVHTQKLEPLPPPPAEVHAPPPTPSEPVVPPASKAPPTKRKQLTQAKKAPIPAQPAPQAPQEPTPSTGEPAPSPQLANAAAPATPSQPPAPAWSPPPPAPSPSVSSTVDLSGYRTALGKDVSRHKRYPTSALRRRHEGAVVVQIVVRRDGSLDGDPRVVKSSAHDALDEEAVRMVLAAAPFPPLPSTYADATARIRLPIEFRVQE